MSSAPAISVLMPVYNAERFVREAIESILRQTMEDFELIGVDDGSRDRSLEILNQLAANDSRIRVISRANTGIAGALNDGLAVARGEFIARIDADDLAEADRFERQLAYLRDHPDCVVVGSAAMLIDPYGTPLRATEPKLSHEQIDADLLAGDGWAIIHPTAMLRTDAVRQVGGYRSQWVPIEDLELFLRLGEIGQLANLPEALLQYRQHRGSANRTSFDKQEALKRPCLAQARQRRGLPVDVTVASSPRPVMSAAEELRWWGWAAVKARRAAVARRHALQLLRIEPFAIGSWKMMYCALRGR